MACASAHRASVQGMAEDACPEGAPLVVDERAAFTRVTGADLPPEPTSEGGVSVEEGLIGSPQPGYGRTRCAVLVCANRLVT